MVGPTGLMMKRRGGRKRGIEDTPRFGPNQSFCLGQIMSEMPSDTKWKCQGGSDTNKTQF